MIVVLFFLLLFQKSLCNGLCTLLLSYEINIKLQFDFSTTELFYSFTIFKFNI